jgi:catechol 2,3-dioxygenase-like lactoylglutathione lyase family enzyme
MSDEPWSLDLDHVQLAAPAGSEGEARRFYGAVLGLAEIAKPPALAGRGGVWFQCGAHQIHIGIEADFRPARKAHIALRVPDVGTLERLRGRLEVEGIAVQPDELMEGVRRFYAADPWGNRLEFLASEA